ncbi:MAG: TDT family transporter [Lachnospirales bacterium]
MSNLLSRVERLHISVVATTVGVCTLGNVYAGLGFPLIRHMSMIFGTVILLAYLYKFIKYPQAIKNDYKNTLLASLYGVVTMLMMLISSYYIKWFSFFKYIIMLAVILHGVQIVIFLYKYLFKDFDKVFFIPSWFVTLNGIMVSTVACFEYLPSTMAKIVFYWGVFAYTVFVPFIIVRLRTVEIKPLTFHTQAILIAPCSLIVATYLKIAEVPNLIFLNVYYACVVLSVIFVIITLPKFFSFEFVPTYAGLTFPMAIGTLCSRMYSAYLINNGFEKFGGYVNQLAGIQLYLTTAIIVYVLFNFYLIFMKKEN